MIEAYYGFLSSIFAPIMALGPMWTMFILAGIICFIITLFYKFMVDQNKMREMKAKMKELQAEIKKVQKENPDKSKEMMNELMKLTNKQMMLNFKPMIPTFIFILAFLPWMASVFPGPVVLLPFNLPYFGNDFGWLMWYFIVSIPFTQLFRKFLGVE